MRWLKGNIKAMAKVNRLKVVLAEKEKTGKWLAESLGRDPATVSKWCTNSSQPDIETYLKIARLLKVDLDDLLTKEIKREVAKAF